MAKEKHQCEKLVYQAGFGRTQCSRNARNHEDGKWWCVQHTPSVIAKKNSTRLAEWRKEWAERDAAAARRARREELRDEIIAHMRHLIKSGVLGDEGISAELIRKLDALDGKGE